MRSRSALLVGLGRGGGVAGGEGGAEPVERLRELGFELGDLTHLCAFDRAARFRQACGECNQSASARAMAGLHGARFQAVEAMK